MPPSTVPVSDGDPSDAFHNQFSTIIRLESHLHGDHSEDLMMGPTRRHWVTRHLAEVARAQGFTSVSRQGTTFNMHTRDFVTSPPAQTQTMISDIDRNSTPWYENFNLADQGVLDTVSRSPLYPLGPYGAFDTAELAEYRAVVRAQLVESSNQHSGSQYNTSGGRFDHTSDPYLGPNHNLPLSQPFSTPSNNSSGVQYPSIPPDQSSRRHRQTTPPDSLPDLVTRTTLRASTEPPTLPPSMGSLTAPDHYELYKIYALEVKIGDYIQSVKNPGEVMDHYPCDFPNYQPTVEDVDCMPVRPNGGLRIQFKGADGTIRSKIFKGLDKVEVLREVVTAKDEEDEVVVKKEDY